MCPNGQPASLYRLGEPQPRASVHRGEPAKLLRPTIFPADRDDLPLIMTTRAACGWHDLRAISAATAVAQPRAGPGPRVSTTIPRATSRMAPSQVESVHVDPDLHSLAPHRRDAKSPTGETAGAVKAVYRERTPRQQESDIRGSREAHDDRGLRRLAQRARQDKACAADASPRRLPKHVRDRCATPRSRYIEAQLPIDI